MLDIAMARLRFALVLNIARAEGLEVKVVDVEDVDEDDDDKEDVVFEDKDLVVDQNVDGLEE